MSLDNKNIYEILAKRKICINKLLKLCKTLIKADFQNNNDEFLRIVNEKSKEVKNYKFFTEKLNTILKQNKNILNKEDAEELNTQEKNYNNFIELDKTLIEKIQFHLNDIKDKLKKENMQSKIYNAYKAF